MKFDVNIFDPKKAILETIASDAGKVTADPKKITAEELVLVSNVRKRLMKARNGIMKTGKATRDSAIKYQKEVISYERSLIEIIAPEEERLKEIEKMTKVLAIRKQRRKKLPELKTRLKSIGDDIKIKDIELLDMDPNEFEAYYNQRVADKNEQDKEAIRTEKIHNFLKKEGYNPHDDDFFVNYTDDKVTLYRKLNEITI